MQRLREHVTALAREMRRRRGPDPARLLSDQGVEVHRRRLANVRGFEVGGHVYLAAGLDEGDARFTLAHELGHVLQTTGSLVAPTRYREWSADLFACELLLPHGVICPRAEVAVPDRARAWQLARAGRLPSIVVVAEAVVCRGCGWRRISRTCECARARRRHAREHLAQTR